MHVMPELKVVVFDQPASVSNDNCWHVRIDGGRSYKILAKWMAEAIGGEGNVVLDQGLQGLQRQNWNTVLPKKCLGNL